ncbi:MAG: VOC family protein [Chitinophagaceae bacterium]
MTKQKITRFLWFDGNAEEAANFYTSVFNNSEIIDTALNPEGSPAGAPGTVLTEGFNIFGQQFVALNGGPEFKFNPSISFMVNCKTEKQVDELWNKLFEGGKALMPLDKYPFSEKYGWLQDKYGLSWQLILSQGEIAQPIIPSLLFAGQVCGKAEEAIKFYTSIFEASKVGNIFRYGANQQPDKEGTVAFADFNLQGEWFAVMDSAREHNFTFNEAVSFSINCESQKEVDYYWEKLSSEGGKESQCGWLKDKYGVSWQVTPTVLPKLLQSNDREKAKRAMQAMLKMKKIIIADLEQA